MAISSTSRPLLLQQVLDDEFETLHRALPSIYQKTGEDRLGEIHRHIHIQKHAALCLSGGGVRSASFGLGVLRV